MNEHGKSDRRTVPAKLPNKAEPAAAEAMEGRGLAEGNTRQANTHRTQSRGRVTSGLERVREVAKRDKDARFSALLHHVTVDLLRTAFRGLNRKAAVGVDGVTWDAYVANVEDNLRELHGRIHRGAYRAQPSRRTYIPKADGRQRPLGIASLEDKIVQGAVVRVLNAIYEEDFVGFSYGFRPGRSQHNALDAVAVGITTRKVNWVLDADLRGFFDAIDHGWLVKFLEHRIADKRILRLIQKWLNAGILEDEVWTKGTVGSPQGANVSPLLANVYLHYAYDIWAQHWRQTHARGDMIVVRYADDTIVGFQHRADAERFLAELHQRMGKFGLELNEAKTRLIEFGRYATSNRAERGLGKPETFDFLGFTHICGKSRKAGKFQLRRHTMRKRLSAKLKAVRTELKRRRHEPIPQIGVWLRSVVNGYFQYHAVPTNIEALKTFRDGITRAWLCALRRRSQKHCMTWKRMDSLAKQWLPPAKIRHPWPSQRLTVTTRGRSRMS